MNSFKYTKYSTMTLQQTIEVNFDGIVGNTHHYGGLAQGNIASIKHKDQLSNPRLAVMEGLDKMKLLHKLGVPQAVLPPHERPYIPALRFFGFTGSDVDIIENAFKEDPALLSMMSSSSAMWVANAATVTASNDSSDKKMHLTVSNMASQLHRRIESQTNERIFSKIFKDSNYFTIHPELSENEDKDEGAANHMRIEDASGKSINIFTYGQDDAYSKFKSRQSFSSCLKIANRHLLDKNHCLFLRQNPRVIDQGVFHNDVIATSHKNFLFCHEFAFKEPFEKIQSTCNLISNFKFCIVEEKNVSVEDAVESYLFNSQLITNQQGEMVLIADERCQKNKQVSKFIEDILEKAENPIKKVIFVDVEQSMKNGGGPACLRLRVPLKSEELYAMHPGIIYTESLDQKLREWAEQYYRDTLSLDDLRDPLLYKENMDSLNTLSDILELGSVYDFQLES